MNSWSASRAQPRSRPKGEAQRNLIIDFSAVPFVDSTGAKTIEGLAHKAAKRGVGVTLTGMSEGCDGNWPRKAPGGPWSRRPSRSTRL